MNSKTILGIAVMGMLGVFAFVIMAMMSVQTLSEQPMVKVRVHIADKFKVREVTLSFDAPQGAPRTLRIGYETSVLYDSLDGKTQEMEAVAKAALEEVRTTEFSEDIVLKREKKTIPMRAPIGLVAIKRTWRNDRGCFKRSEESTHEWTPPPVPASK
jgi:hypothetical protein